MTDPRLGSLSDILAKPPRPRGGLQTPDPDQAAPEPPPAPAPDSGGPAASGPAVDAEPARPAARTRGKSSGATASKDTPRARANATEATRPRVATRLSKDLHEQLAEHAVRHRLSYAAVLLLAVEKAHADQAFPALLDAARRGEGSVEAPVGGGLFSPQMPRPRAAAKVPVEFQPHHSDLEKLDELWRSYGAKDRTEFLTVALEHYFAAMGTSEAAAG